MKSAWHTSKPRLRHVIDGRKVSVVDFETYPIKTRPHYPPCPVGVAIKRGSLVTKYYKLRTPTEINYATDLLHDIFRNDVVVFHNARFDIDVAEEHLGVTFNKDRFRYMHDTAIMLFLHDPDAESFSLKPSAEKYLGIRPEERDLVSEWIVTHQPAEAIALNNGARITPSRAMAFTAFAPDDLVERYAIGDVDRTHALFSFLYDDVMKNMCDAYDRERRLVFTLLRMERVGINVDVGKLERDISEYTRVLANVDRFIWKKLKREFNIDSGKQLVEALVASGHIHPSAVVLTEKGNAKSDKETLARTISDRVLSAVLQYRSQVMTSVNTFMRPWFEVAANNNGIIHTSWNQVRRDGAGAVTGRLSSSPNLQNIPKTFDPLFDVDGTHRDKPKPPSALFLQQPNVRSYVVPPRGHVLLGRDYSQQELRILACVDGTQLLDDYRENPWLDLHDHARTLINKVLGTNFDRKPIKNTAFGLIYGMGLGKLAEKSKTNVETAAVVRRAYINLVVPGLAKIYADMKQRAHDGEPVWTLGGRRYYCEAPRVVRGRIQEYDYKLLNRIIQGTAADCTKQAMNNFDDAIDSYPLGKNPPLMHVTVHDEFLVSSLRGNYERDMEILRESMESIDYGVPMLSEGKIGIRDWANMRNYDVAGKIVVKRRKK